MKYIASLCLLLFALSAQAQNQKRVYPVGQLYAITEISGATTYFPLNVVTVTFGDNINVRYQASGYTLSPSEFLNSLGAPYGSSVATAQAAWNAAVQAAQSPSAATPTTVTSTYLGASSNFTIAAGASLVSILNNGNTDVSVQGTALSPGATVNYTTKYGQVLDAIAVNATGGSVRYLVIR